MRREHRPSWMMTLRRNLDRAYTRHFVRPRFDHLGKDPVVLNPRFMRIHGKNIRVGDYVHLANSPFHPIELATSSVEGMNGHINIGNCCLVSPGMTMYSATDITIGHDCMFGGECYVSDCDWHGIYNRNSAYGRSKPIELKDNVWVGHGAKILKGVTIGENSVVGAGAVVTRSIPPNVIAGGNPAVVLKEIDTEKRMITRGAVFTEIDDLIKQLNTMSRFLYRDNRLRTWLRTVIWPTSQD